MPDQAELPEPGAQRVSLERIALRVRGKPVTLAGWRMEITSPRGKGAIVHAEPHWRGEGICLGFSQEKLAALYHALAPHDEPSGGDSIQLG